MTHTARPPALALVPLDPAGPDPVWRRVAEGVRRRIVAGELAAGTRLPSSRMLARDLGVSRNTVLAAYEALFGEGYVEGHRGSGTFVAHELPQAGRPRFPLPGPVLPQVAPPTLSRRGATIAASFATWRPTAGLPRPFRPGVPAIDLFPWRSWRSVCNGVLRHHRSDLFGYGDPRGYLPLREAIAAHVGTTRGVRCKPAQVIVVEGAEQGLDFATRVLVDAGDAVAIEDPGYLGARAAGLGAGARVVPIRVDQEGLDVAALQAAEERVRLVYVSPSHQFPLGATLPAERRLALLGWAARSDAWVVEDDYDSEFRYAALPVPSLQSLDQDGRVIYVGSFSKVLFPGLRLGYVIVPEPLLEAFAAARFLAGVHAPVFHQVVLTEFIQNGDLLRHIRRMRAAYAERQRALIAAAAEHLDGLELTGGEIGMKLIAWLPAGWDDADCAAAAAAEGVDAYPLSRYALRPLARGGLLLGYAGWPPEELTGAAARLGRALRRFARISPASPPGPLANDS